MKSFLPNLRFTVDATAPEHPSGMLLASLPNFISLIVVAYYSGGDPLSEAGCYRNEQ